MKLGQTNIRPTGSVPARCPQSFGDCAFVRRVVSMLRTICAVIWLGIAVSAHGQGLGRADLLNSENLPAGDGATVETGASRARYIRINSPLLTASDSPLHQPAPADLQLDSSRLKLSLFTDTVLTAALERTLYRNDTNFTASGVIDEWPGSRVIVVVEGEVIAASINVPGLGLFQIRYDTNGFHKILEIDPSQLPGCKTIKKAPKKPRPIKLSKKKNIPPITNGSEPGDFLTPPPMMFNAASMFSGNIFALQPPVEPDASSNTNVDVMVVYTAAAKTGAGGVSAMNTLIDLAIAEANDAYVNSLIPVTLNLVYRGEVTYTESGNASTDLTRLQSPSDGQMDAVHSIRDQYGADMVCLFTETMQSTYAGLGYLMTTVSTNFSSYAFSVIRRTYATGNHTFAHELGHNMGCTHDRQNSSSQGAYDYSYGYRFVGNDSATYRTVMAYAPGTRIPYFSNPNVNYQGVATGVAAGATNSANNAASISNTVPTVSAFRAPIVVFSFTASTNAVTESTNTVAYDVRRSGPTNSSVTVNYATSDGTAGILDYMATNGTLTFAAGETNKTVSLVLLEDDAKESVETLSITLSSPSVGTLFTSNLTVYISDNDSSYVTFASAGFSVYENTNNVSLELQRTGVTNTAVTVNYFTTNSTALSGSDYVSTNGLVSFAAGETSKTFTVTVLNDIVAENSEAFLVRLRTPTNTALGTLTNFTLTILTNDKAVIAFSAAATSINESNSTVDVTVSRTGTTDNTATVDFTTTNVTATAGSDYTATNGTVTFTNGVTSQTITLVLANDVTLESSETFQIRLSNPSDATLGTLRTNTVTITDDDISILAFDVSTNLVSETNETITFSVLRTGVTNTEVTVNYITTNVTAVAIGDYVASSGLLTFAAGVVSNGFSLTLTNDLLQESSETFQVRLINPTNTTVSVATNTITITDDDAASVAFLHGTTNVSEGVGTMTITAVRTGATNTAATVRFYSTNGTATAASDYFATNGILSFAVNEVSKSFELRIINDLVAENAETVFLRLVSPTNCTVSGFGTNLVTINTNDSAYVSWSVSSVSTNESTNTITLTVNRTGTTFNDVTVDFATTNVTATAGTDYTATNGTVTFTNGVTSQSITLLLANDDLQESSETLQVRLSNPSDGILTNGTNTITITDDDNSTLAFATNAISSGESNVTLTIVVERSGATNTAVAVNFTTTNVTATAASDYTATNGTLYFAPGIVSNSFTADILHDLSLEGSETFQLRLSSATNTTLATATNTVTITDDDAASVAFTTNAITVSEDVGTVTLTAVRTGATNTTVSVNFTNLSGTTATAVTDFTATNGLLVFAPGVTTNTFAVIVINDLVAENSEAFSYRFLNVTNCTIGNYGTNTVTISTNDSAVLAWSITATNISESGANLTLTVNRTGTTFNEATVDFTTTNVTAAMGSDYTATNGTLTFTNGVASQDITLLIASDDLQEANETLRVVLSNPTDATITSRTNTITITDDDGSTLTFTTNAVTLPEEDTGVTLTVVRSGATNTAVSVDFTTTNVTATADNDYTATDGTLYFAPGEATNTITLDLLPDLTYEINETFRVVLSGITNSTLAVGTNTITITDDDLAYLGFTVDSDSVNELDGTIDIVVERTGVTDTEVSASFTTTNSTALSGTDYTATNGVVTFAPGETLKTITVSVAFDDDLETSEIFRIRLVSLTNAASATYTNIPITIADSFGGVAGAPLRAEPVEITSIQSIGEGFLRLHVSGPKGTPFVIETSSDLTTWVPVVSNVVPLGGLDWITPIDRTIPARYFRVVPPQ